MSTQVHISIGDGNASRHLSIDLQSEPRLNEEGRRDPSEFGEYAVVVTGGSRTREPVAAEFHHRYGDDVFTLINEAIAALREQGIEQA